MLKILIADDHEIIRKGLKLILLEEFTFAQIEEASDGETLVQKALSKPWDIVISDISMPRMTGLEALKLIRQQNETLPVLILSIQPEEQYTKRVLQMGASGYLGKQAATSELVNAVKIILQGRHYIPPAARHAFAMKNEPSEQAHEALSTRELEVLRLIAGGETVKKIAEKLQIGITTVSTYRARILEKMQLKSNAELTRYALDNKLF